MIRQQQQQQAASRANKINRRLNVGRQHTHKRKLHGPAHTYTHAHTRRTHSIHTHMLCQHTIASSSPHNLTVRLPLYHGCLESLRDGVIQTWCGSSSSKQRKTKQTLKRGVPAHQCTDFRPAWTCTHVQVSYSSAHRTDTHMQCPHTHSSGPRKLDVRLLLCRGCYQKESFYSSEDKTAAM